MGCYVHVSLPPLPGSECCDSIGASVQYMRRYASHIQHLGVPGVDDTGIFMHHGEDTEDIGVTRDALQVELDRLSGLLDTGCADVDWDETYGLYLYVTEWVHLYDTVIKLRARGVAADLFGA